MLYPAPYPESGADFSKENLLENVQIGGGHAVERLQHFHRNTLFGQRIVHRVERQFGRVVLLTEVAQKDMRERFGPVVGQKTRGVVVAQMPSVAAHTLFERIGIAAVFEHRFVVISLDNQIVGLGDVVGNLLADEAQIGGNDKCFAVVGEGITHAVGGIVAHRKRLNGEIANDDVFAFFVEFSARHKFFRYTVVAVDAFMHFARAIHRNVVFFAQHTHRADVVGMVVCDENAPNLLQRNVVAFQFAFHSAHANTSIDKKAVFARTDVVAVAAAAAAHAQKTQTFFVHRFDRK